MNLLLVTYEFPPRGGPGIQRPLQTARLLDAMGWGVTVLTVEDPPTALRDEDALASLPASVKVLRAWSLEPTRALQMARRGKSDAPAASGPGYSGASSGSVRFVQAFFLPDEKVGWTSYAVRAAAEAHAETPFDVVLASGPPFTAYRVAWQISRKLGIPWVADVRDPIVDNYFKQPPTPLHASYLRSFERRVTERAARVIAVTEPLATAIAERNPGAYVVTITNGYDPDDFADLAPPGRPTFDLAYVGGFQGSVAPDVTLEGVARALTRSPQLAGDLRVRFVGPSADVVRGAVERLGLQLVVETTGFVSHSTAVAEMRRADALLLVLGAGPEMRAVLTGKLPEYVATGHPILGLVPGDGAAADVLRRYGAAEIVPPDDPDATSAAILRLYEAWKGGTLPSGDARIIAEFDRTVLVARLDALLKEVVAENRAAHG